MKRVSIHITTLNRATEVTMLLQSLRHQTFQDFDIVIIDGSDTQLYSYHFFGKMILMLQNDGHKVIYQKAEVVENCKQRNQAVKADTTGNPYICRIDDDCILSTNYLQSLYDLLEAGCDMASGVTPSINGNLWKRDPSRLTILNDLQFNSEGDIIVLGDDCGFDYLSTPPIIFQAKHLRSSFMYKREIHDKGITYKTPGKVAFREETEFCLRAAWAGYTKFAVDTTAKAWHFQANSGGCRTTDYAQQVRLGDERFKAWAKRRYLKEGDPFGSKS